MADYDAQLKKLYAKYQLAIGKLTELLEVRIANPVNCMSEVMAKLVIPKKYQAEALDLFKAQYDVWSCHAGVRRSFGQPYRQDGRADRKGTVNELGRV